jgi:hypothetical protein
MANLPPRPPRPSPSTALRRMNEVEQGARNMVNQRKRTKMAAKQQKNQNKQAMKNTRITAKANVDRRRQEAATARRNRNNAGQGRVGQKRTDTMRQLDEYIDYCNNLRESYDTKHGEVEEATRRINGIKDRLNGLTDKILKNIRKIQDLNNVSNLSNLSNRSNVDGFMGNEGRNNTDEILAILQGIIDKLPEGFRADINRLRGLKQEQERMTAERGRNHDEINSRLDDITARVGEIHEVKEGMMPKKPERRTNRGVPGRPRSGGPGRPSGGPGRPSGGLSLPDAPSNSPVARRVSAPPTNQRRRNAVVAKSAPTTPRAKRAQTQLNRRLNRSTMKMVTGKGGPLKQSDFGRKFTPGNNL